MTKKSKAGREGCVDAAQRVAEVSRLFESIRQTLDQMIQAIGEPNEQTPKTIITKLNELQAAHLRVLAAEEAFYAQNGHAAREGNVDLGKVRLEVGRQLDRIREAILANKVSSKTQPE